MSFDFLRQPFGFIILESLFYLLLAFILNPIAQALVGNNPIITTLLTFALTLAFGVVYVITIRKELLSNEFKLKASAIRSILNLFLCTLLFVLVVIVRTPEQAITLGNNSKILNQELVLFIRELAAGDAGLLGYIFALIQVPIFFALEYIWLSIVNLISRFLSFSYKKIN